MVMFTAYASQAVFVSKKRLSLHQIITRLKVSKGAVHGALKCFKESVGSPVKALSDTPKATTSSEDQYIMLTSLRDRKTTSSQIQNSLNKKHKIPIGKSAVRKRPSCSGLRGARHSF